MSVKGAASQVGPPGGAPRGACKGASPKYVEEKQKQRRSAKYYPTEVRGVKPRRAVPPSQTTAHRCHCSGLGDGDGRRGTGYLEFLEPDALTRMRWFKPMAWLSVVPPASQ